MHAAEVAKYTASAYKRRADAVHSAASSAYGRAAKDIAERNAAVTYAERLADAVVDYAPELLPPETRPGVIAWLPLAFEHEGRAAFERSCDNRRDNRSYPTPAPVEEYEAACRSVFAGVARLREQAAKQARTCPRSPEPKTWARRAGPTPAHPPRPDSSELGSARSPARAFLSPST